jgi:putative endonuclease
VAVMTATLTECVRGQVAQRAGLAAEDGVARAYGEHGCAVLQTRWRGRGGEIDLILDEAGTVVFVEVKKAKDFSSAAARIGPRQTARLMRAAEEYLGGLPNGALTDCRFDAALVDDVGRVQIVENAFM